VRTESRRRRDRLRARLVLAGLLATLLPGGTRSAPAPARATLTVFAAASLAEAFAPLGRRIESQRPGLDVRFSFAGSQQLAAQIDQGVRADVFASADERWMEWIRERGRIAGAPTTFGRNRLVVIVPRTNPARIRRLEDVARRGVKVVIGADAVPVGRYSREALGRLSRLPGYPERYAQRVIANVVSEEENTTSVLGKIRLGEADAGIVYRSDVTPSAARLVRTLEIPDSANVLATYPIAVVADAPNDEAARAFVELVLSQEGQAILAAHGLLPATLP
jgi:molybdate transport system substrate-binding protein